MDILEKIKNNKIFNYLKEIVSWTIFTILSIIGILLLYYFISVRLYSIKGDKFEPKFSVYTIVSGSMTPTINVYDVIINTKVNNINDVKINDVITFVSTWEINSGMIVTHRVVGIKKLDDGETCLITRGDYNTNEDQSCVKKENLIGVTKAVIPGLGNIRAILLSKTGWLLIIILPSLYIITKNVLKIVKLGNIEVSEKKYSDNKDLDNAYKDLKKIRKKRK